MNYNSEELNDNQKIIDVFAQFFEISLQYPHQLVVPINLMGMDMQVL